MRQKLTMIIFALFTLVCLSTTGFAASPYQFSSDEGKRFIWDQESNSGICFPSDFDLNHDFLPIGISISSDSMQVELIPQDFPDEKETFWNFAYYSTSRFHLTGALENLNIKTFERDRQRILCTTFERQALLHESHYFRYQLLAFIERGRYEGDLLIVRSDSPVDLEAALSYYRFGLRTEKAALSSPSERILSPVSNPEDPLQTLLPATNSGTAPLWGIFEPSAPRSLSKVKTLERQLATDFPLILRYTNFADSFEQLAKDMKTAADDERIVELTLQTNEDNRLDSSIYAVLDGYYDEEIRQLARIVRDQKSPVLFRLNNEMNGDWCNYSALHFGLETRLYRDLWQWIYQVFQEEGATNARWVFNPNERSFPNYRWNHMLAYLPPANQIHAVGLTGYNTGTYYQGESWRSFQEIYQPIYEEYNRIFHYPLLITEFSSSSVGGNKEMWIREMFDVLDQFPRLEGLIWWSYADYDRTGTIARPYYIDETPNVIQAFKSGMEAFKSKKNN